MSDPEGINRKQFLASLAKGALGLAAAGLAGPGRALAAGARPESTPTLAPLPYALVQTGKLDPVMDRPLGIAIGPGDLLHCAGAAGVKVLDAGGRPLRTLATAGPACCVAVDSLGNVYAAGRTRVEKFNAAGERTLAWGERGDGPGQLRFVTALAANERFVYVADSGARKIHRFAADGDYVDEIAGYAIPAGNPCCAPLAGPAAGDQAGGAAEKGFVIPSGYFDCALDARGFLHVGHTGLHRVERYDPNHALVGWWGRFGAAREDFCGCCNPTNLALFPDGRIATSEKGVPRLKVYDAAGTLLAYLGEAAFPGNTAGLDLAIDSSGRIALLEPIRGEVRFYELRPSRA